MNTGFWHKRLIRALQASLFVLCAGFISFSIVANHSHGSQKADTPLVALVSAADSTPATAHANHQQEPSMLPHEHGSTTHDVSHQRHGALGSEQSTEPCFTPCDGALPCPSVCALACAASGVSAPAIGASAALPQRCASTFIPNHDDTDAIVELTHSPLYRPPIS